MQIPFVGKKKAAKDDQSTKHKAKPGLNDIKHKAKQWLEVASRYQATIIALAVALLLALTSLRMLRYMNPPVDDNQVQKNLSKFKQIRIDPKIVQKIEQLQSTGTSASPKIENSRTNPFSE
jgi:hypothetical protein